MPDTHTETDNFYTAACAWEWILEQRHLDNVAVIAKSAWMGAAALRYATVALVPSINEAYAMGNDLDYDSFDWDFVPDFMEHCLDWSENVEGLELHSDWKDRAAKLWEARDD